MPGTKALTLTGHAPIVNNQVGVVVPTVALATDAVRADRHGVRSINRDPDDAGARNHALRPGSASANHLVVTPTTRALTTARFAPSVSTTSHQLLTPAKKTLTVTRYAPTVTTSTSSGASFYIAPTAMTAPAMAPSVARG